MHFFYAIIYRLIAPAKLHLTVHVLKVDMGKPSFLNKQVCSICKHVPAKKKKKKKIYTTESRIGGDKRRNPPA
jgi:hypothetical protein